MNDNYFNPADFYRPVTEHATNFPTINNPIMSQEEIYKLAHAVAEILQNGNNPDQVSNRAVVNGGEPKRKDVNDKLIDDMVAHMANEIGTHLHTDEEQYIAVCRLRNRMATYWEDQLKNSVDVSTINTQRAETLGKLIETTIPR